MSRRKRKSVNMVPMPAMLDRGGLFAALTHHARNSRQPQLEESGKTCSSAIRLCYVWKINWAVDTWWSPSRAGWHRDWLLHKAISLQSSPSCALGQPPQIFIISLYKLASNFRPWAKGSFTSGWKEKGYFTKWLAVRCCSSMDPDEGDVWTRQKCTHLIWQHSSGTGAPLWSAPAWEWWI